MNNLFAPLKLAVGAVALLMASSQAMAIPAHPRQRVITQPDGSQITVTLRGDEHHHLFFTTDGYPIISRDGTFFYATVGKSGLLEPSAVMVRPQLSAQDIQAVKKIDLEAVLQAADRSAAESPRRARRFSNGPGLFPGANFPAMGETPVCVVLVEYKDKKFTIDDPVDYFSRMLNEPGFSDYGATGSALDYFTQNSMGLFTPKIDVLGPVTLKNKMSYYGGNDYWGNDNHPEEMAIEACAMLDDEVDFSVYDTDNDGYIDNVYVIYAGKGEASYGSDDTVWPHSWNISEVRYTLPQYDGVKLDRYACSNEWESERPDGIGTFVHEFSHVMGLPDLYATSYTNAFTPGDYSALDSGPYNNDGRTPPAYGAFERYSLGWLEPTVIDDAAFITLGNVMDNEACIIHTHNDNEFFLLENRQNEGWDTYIPGHGMLVWHIDYNEEIWANNEVNNTPGHQYVDIEEADNKRTEYTRDGDTFPGTSGKTEFTDLTSPSMRAWDRTVTALPITNIKEENGMISFSVKGGTSAARIVFADTSLKVAGRVAEISTSPNAPIRLYDVTGRLVAAVTADSDGRAAVTLSAKGLYMMVAPSGSSKFEVR